MLTPHTIQDLYDTIGLSSDGEVNFTIQSVPDIHPEIPFRSPVLRADYFSFILTTRGRGVYKLDDQLYSFGDHSLYFTNPGHVKSYELHESKEAKIIMVNEHFLTRHVDHKPYDEFPFLLAELVPPHNPEAADFSDYQQLFAQIEEEFRKPSKYKNKILGNLMLVLLLKIKEKFWADYNPIEDGKHNDSKIVRAFKQALEDEFGKILGGGDQWASLQARHFGEQLNLHPNYLNAVIKSKTGRTLKEWISGRTIEVAKSLLIKSDYSAKEIGYLLGCSEPTHFGRFFKKHTSLTPIAYRKVRKVD